MPVRLQDAGIPKTDTETEKKVSYNAHKTLFFNNLGSIVRGTSRATRT